MNTGKKGYVKNRKLLIDTNVILDMVFQRKKLRDTHFYPRVCQLFFPPYKAVNNPRIALNDFNNFAAYIPVPVIRHGNAVIPVPVHPEA